MPVDFRRVRRLAATRVTRPALNIPVVPGSGTTPTYRKSSIETWSPTPSSVVVLNVTEENGVPVLRKPTNVEPPKMPAGKSELVVIDWDVPSLNSNEAPLAFMPVMKAPNPTMGSEKVNVTAPP